MSDQAGKRSIIDSEALPSQFPTHAHDAQFWENLGRTIATFGFLEEVLGKAIFAFSGTKQYSEDAIAEAMEKWLPRLENALHQPLNPLIDVYVKSVREHQSSTPENLTDLEHDLREAAKIRNVLCHGSWRTPDKDGASLPFFVNKQMMVFDTAVDVVFLKQTQGHVAELACAVINSVTHMGWEFPGGGGLGKPIWTRT